MLLLRACVASLSTAAAILIGMSQSAIAQQGPGTCGYMMGSGWHGWFLGPLLMLALLAAATFVAVLIVRASMGGGGSPAPASSSRPWQSDSPVDILKQRFAKGEIDKEEYEARCKVLGV